MAHITANAGSFRPVAYLMGWVESVADSMSRYRVYKRTHDELSSLSSRELEDLGISRSMITRLAYEAAYEN
ncbi:DUF1127 domain-containing protein [Roseinatronobacter alkalisoli]|uniref:DUF1127 domain-containing protein n=1 Tax=Roseinatronobacter alkalisoli TaxID=3028235 RepID=A0ABT5T6G5_9RHOB|nr:DUF1127 domain-containing protein [Roseinatronobacter sp. HJB301]MDD7970705.1 DUF1127 domain-containing protein [Roseinatronobacter sp. HJB301]